VPKKRIAILGGGIGAITTAFELTKRPDWKDQFESITVYQMGWRLGGKGATGRNSKISDRIEEHGLHVFMGFYDNAFNMMKDVYDECAAKNLTPRSPFPTIEHAFSPLNLIVLTEDVGKQFELWPMLWPKNPGKPGDSAPLTGAGVKPFMVRLTLLAVDEIIAALPVPGPLRTVLLNAARMLAESGLTRVIANIVVHAATAVSGLLHQTLGLPWAAGMVHTGAKAALRAAGAGKQQHAETHEMRLSELRSRVQSLDNRLTNGQDAPDADVQLLFEEVDKIAGFLMRAMRALIGGLSADVRRAIYAADLALTVVRGILGDGMLDGSFDKIDDLDLAEWLTKHGSLFEGRNVLTRGFYDAAFAYDDGEPDRPNFAAGRALYGMLRLILTYRGSISWRMNAGMGETIFTPLFKVLEDRGVKFEFFQKVTNLGLSPDRKRIENIKIEVQAELKPECNGRYNPLIDVETAQGVLSCWPTHPKFDDLVQGLEMQKPDLKNPNLESYWTDWKPTPELERTLVVGDDFDEVVLGISLGALPFICKELIAQSGTPAVTSNFDALDKWRNMTTNIKSIRTQGLQLWLNRTLKDMGFELPPKFSEPPLLCSFVEPYDTWCDMTHLSSVENFKPSPKQIAYFCNVAPRDPDQPGFSDHDYPKRQTAKARLTATEFLNKHAKTIWSRSILKSAPTKFDVNQIIEQFVQLNIDPSEQYVLNVKGSDRYRLHPADSGFTNLYLAGDWTKCIVDLGCAEAAVISGKLAAAGIMNSRAKILGLIGAKMEEEVFFPQAHTAGK
jgi:uncharacterized protein with NAD-binding domain and iron-sulfur cluster